MTPSIKSKMRKKLNLWHANRRSKFKDRNLTQKYNKLKKTCNKQIKNTVRAYEENIAKNAKNNPKMVYSYMNSKKAIKDNIRALNDEAGKRVEDPDEIVKILNKQFKSVFEVDNGLMPEINKIQKEYDWGDLTNINEEKIFEKIKNLNEFKVFGVDKVSNSVLKNCARSFVKPLKLIFDKSLNAGEVPKEWGEANVTPIFKKGSKLFAANYRPVSLTSSICKLLESIVRDNIMKYLQLKK